MSEKIPDYAFQPLRACLDSIITLDRLLHLSMHGLGIVSKRPEMVERVIFLTKEAGEQVTEKLESDLRSANEDAAFAKKEIDSGFPQLHAFTVVGYWAALESGIEDMLVGIMGNEPKILEVDALSKIRIPLSKYEQLEKEERMRFLLSEFQRAEATGLTQGVNTFENVLRAFDLSGNIDATLRTALWDLNNLRNIIVHRNSRADRRFIQNCPSFDVKIGDRVAIDHSRYASLTEGVLSYLLILIGRLGPRYNAPVPKWVTHFYPLADGGK